MSSWFKRPINIAITVVAVLMALMALSIIIWKVATRDLDEEAPVLEVCWANGQAYYIAGVDEGEGEFRDEEPCEGSSESVWPTEEIPLRLFTTSPSGESLDEDEAVQRVVRRAIRDFNSQAGCELVVGVPSGSWPSAHVYVHWGTAIEVGGESSGRSLGSCSHRGAGTPIEAHIAIRGGLSDRLSYLVLLHEIGHVFGLGHNSFRRSVMFPLTVDDTERENMTGGRLSDGTIHRLSRYCPQ